MQVVLCIVMLMSTSSSKKHDNFAIRGCLCRTFVIPPKDGVVLNMAIEPISVCLLALGLGLAKHG